MMQGRVLRVGEAFFRESSSGDGEMDPRRTRSQREAT